MKSRSIKVRTTLWLAAFIATALPVSISFAEMDMETPHAGHSDHSSAPTPSHPTPRTSSGNWHAREGVYFQRKWGIDIVGVHPVSAGYMLEFRYRVLDPKKAQRLTDKKIRPYLIDEATNTTLAVPTLRNVGEVRQGGFVEENRTYFIIFGNPGRLVKSGNRVSVVIGDFRVDGLVVD